MNENLVNRAMQAFWSAPVPHANMGHPERFIDLLEEVAIWLNTQHGTALAVKLIEEQIEAFTQQQAADGVDS